MAVLLMDGFGLNVFHWIGGKKTNKKSQPSTNQKNPILCLAGCELPVVYLVSVLTLGGRNIIIQMGKLRLRGKGLLKDSQLLSCGSSSSPGGVGSDLLPHTLMQTAHDPPLHPVHPV